MQELKDWLNDPMALKFKKILENSRKKVLNDISHGYVGQGGVFNKDLVLSSLGGCEALEQVTAYFGTKDEELLENLLKLFFWGENE